MNVCVIGTGYVGLVTGVCFSSLGHHVICVEQDHHKVQSLQDGVVPIYEPGLKERLDQNRNEQRLSFTTDMKRGMAQAEVIIIAVGTPANKDGSADLSFIKRVSLDIGHYLTPGVTVVTKSTVPIGTNRKIKQWIAFSCGHQQFSVASCPEFLREGNAIKDTLEMERAVFGVEDAVAETVLRQLHEPIHTIIVVTSIETAEAAKYAANAFLATKISFINEVANVCENVGADIEALATIMGLDHRIGPSYLQAGVGYGGSCFPKDTQAFIRVAQQAGYDLQIVPAVEKVNQEQRQRLFNKLKNVYSPSLAGKRVAILGLAFKPDTDDMRAAPSIDLVEALHLAGATTVGYDPVAQKQAQRLLPNLVLTSSWQEAVKSADAVFLLTDWPEFKAIDLNELKSLMHEPIVIDGRNLFAPEEMLTYGFYYDSIGRTKVDGRFLPAANVFSKALYTQTGTK